MKNDFVWFRIIEHVYNDYDEHSPRRSTFHSSGKSRSQRRLAAAQLPWYRKPLLREHKRVSIQKAAVVTSICSMVCRRNLMEVGGHLCVCVYDNYKYDTGGVSLHHCDVRLRHLLSGNGAARLHALRLLHDFVRVRVRGQSKWYACMRTQRQMHDLVTR